MELLHVMGRPHNYLQIFLKCLSAPIKSQKSFWILKRNWKIKEKKKQGAFCKSVVDFNPDDHRRVAMALLAVFFAARTPPAALAVPLRSLHRREEKRSPLPSQLRRGSPTAAAEDLDGAEQISPPSLLPDTHSSSRRF